MRNIRKETDSLGEVDVPADELWGAQTQRSLEHFSIGKDLIPREMITAYAILKKAAAAANHAGKRLGDQQYKLITQSCDEILGGQHHSVVSTMPGVFMFRMASGLVQLTDDSQRTWELTCAKLADGFDRHSSYFGNELWAHRSKVNH